MQQDLRTSLMELPSGYEVIGVAAENVPLVSQQCIELIEPMLYHGAGEFSANDLMKLCQADIMQLWIGVWKKRVNAVAVTEVLSYPKLKSLRIIILVGINFEDWKDGFEKIEAWARSVGCSRMEALTRPGVVKLTAPWGFKEKYRVIHKEFLPLTLQ